MTLNGGKDGDPRGTEVCGSPPACLRHGPRHVYQRPGGLLTTSGFQNEKRKLSGFACVQHQRPEIEIQFPLKIFYLDVIGLVAPAE